MPSAKKEEASSKAMNPTKKRKQEIDESEYVESVLSSFESDASIVLTAKEAFEHVITFGKHKGSTIKEIMTTQKGRIYLKYVREKWEGLRDEQKAAIDKAFEIYNQM